jgi:hypothetical protein
MESDVDVVAHLGPYNAVFLTGPARSAWSARHDTALRARLNFRLMAAAVSRGRNGCRPSMHEQPRGILVSLPDWANVRKGQAHKRGSGQGSTSESRKLELLNQATSSASAVPISASHLRHRRSPVLRAHADSIH